jgi:hypothetical protein
MVPTAVPSGILFFAKLAQKRATFSSFFIFGVQKCSRTVFARGEVLVQIAFFRRNIVTVFAHELLLATFGYFWVQKLIVTTVVGRHGMQIGWRDGL